MFDILIVYDVALAHSAADTSYHEAVPFSKTSSYCNCNATYQYFIEYCAEQGLSAGFTTTQDITPTGRFRSVWTYNAKWERQLGDATGKVLFDKFSSLHPRNQVAYSYLTQANPPAILFHNQAMRVLFDDKLATYLRFPEVTIPTVAIDSFTTTGFSRTKKALRLQCQKHSHPEDFGTDFVMKDQFGIGGNNIFKIQPHQDVITLAASTPYTHYVMQPFIDASGFTIAKIHGKTDLRVIIYNEKIVQSYLRIAKAGEFRANAQQGGTVVYLQRKQIPKDILTMVKSIQQNLPIKPVLYTLDFVKSNSGQLYFIEGNTSPGLNWFDPEDELRAKELIHLIVENLQELIVHQAA